MWRPYLLYVRSTRRWLPFARPAVNARGILTLAIETSCDDTSVAVLEKRNSSSSGSIKFTEGSAAVLRYHQKVTSDNARYGGIYPVAALESHQTHLAAMIDQALEHLPSSSTVASHIEQRDPHSKRGASKHRPDFISVTRGPGMRSNLNTGLDTAKGLSLAWQIPLLAVHHMQAHALTPRLVHALNATAVKFSDAPSFPYLSLLVSGGHTLLVRSEGIAEHYMLASTSDMAIGDMLDKAARLILPEDFLPKHGNVVYGRLLEKFVTTHSLSEYEYEPPADKGEDLSRVLNKWGWSFGRPLATAKSGSKKDLMEFSFSGLLSTLDKIARGSRGPMSTDERVDLGREIQRVAFEHLASRVLLALDKISREGNRAADGLPAVVLSGGVACNQFLQEM
ncbi:MAG: hypothetical protein M1817_001542 [Caeruleum heppii]|nr:MAG: hypothetical protein M1817_001542 [Caeruleum heppii]